MAANTLLVIDSDEQRRRELAAILAFIDCDPVITRGCSGFQDGVSAETLLTALVGKCQSEADLLEVFRNLKAWAPEVPILLLGEEKSWSHLPKDVTAKIVGYIEFPIKYRQLTSAIQRAQIFRENSRQADGSRSPELFRSLVGNSRSVRQVRKLIEQVADSDANVLILGESGTGKEVVARNIHYQSSRRDKAFVPINCGAIPADLLESELFGHEKGAFTGAISTRQGRFEMAEGGTLFLDEIGDMTLHMQVKLLRVLQERTFERVGSNKSITADVRIVAATHRNLEEAIEQGKFREDLFYRLNVFPIEMPPLRERAEDVPLLVSELVTRLEHEKRGSVRLTQGAIVAMCQYHWPGNVRELANLIERLVIMYPFGLVDMQDLPAKFRSESGEPAERMIEQDSTVTLDPLAAPRLPREGIDLKQHLNDLEYNLIKQALDDAGGIVAHAANRLKLRRTTLVEKLRKYGLHRGEEMT